MCSFWGHHTMASIKFRGVWYFSQSLSAANLSCKARLQREKLATDHPTCWAFSVNLHHGQVFSASHFFQGEIRAKFEVFNRFCLSSITLAGSTTWRIFHYSAQMGSSKLCRVHVELLLFTVWERGTSQAWYGTGQQPTRAEQWTHNFIYIAAKTVGRC